MGLREAWQRFNTPVFDWKNRRNLIRWTEPPYSRVRLKGDLGWRLLIVLGICLLFCGIFAILFASNLHRPSLLLALAMGGFFGLLLGGLVLLPRKSETGGSVIIAPECIQRQRYCVGLTYTIVTETWPYSVIDHCVIVPSTEIGFNFSLLQFSAEGTTEFITVPASIKPIDLAQILVEKGVSVAKGQSVPTEMKRSMNQTVGWGVLLAGGLIFLFGMSYFSIIRFMAPHNRWGQIAEQPVVPRQVPRIRPNPAQIAPSVPKPPIIVPSHPVPPAPPGPNASMHDGRQATGPANPFDAAPENPFDATSAGSATDQAKLVPEGAAENPFELKTIPAASDAHTSDATGKPQPQSDASVPTDEENPFASRASSQSTTPSATSGLKTTRFVGSEAGIATTLVDPERRPLLGLRCTFTTDAGATRCVNIETVHTRDSGSKSAGAVIARDGYAVLALRIRTASHVTGLQIAFARIGVDGKLDSHDTYISDWQGDASGGSLETLNGKFAKVLGIEMRRESNFVTALALVFE